MSTTSATDTPTDTPTEATTETPTEAPKESPPATPAAPKRRKPWLLMLLLLLAVLFVWSLFPPKWRRVAAVPRVDKKLERKCKVTRDAFDVPHISASSTEAVFYCWGRVQALDRGWQMDFLRRRAHGRVAEVFGMRYVRDDFQMRILQLRPIADRWMQHYKKKSPKELKLLRFYVWGINDGFAKLKTSKEKPYIWKKLKYHPPAWELRDTLMISILQSFYQTQRTFIDDLKHARLRVKLGALRYRQLYKEKGGLRAFAHTIIKPGEHPLLPPLKGAKEPPVRVVAPTVRKGAASRPAASRPVVQPTTRPLVRPASQPAKRSGSPQPPLQPAPPVRPSSLPVPRTPAPRRSLRVPRQQERLAQLDALIAYFAPYAEIGGGSNNWVVAPKRSASGHALLANDPHLSIGTPSFWHEVHLRAPGLDVLGIGVPGTPAIVSGNNRKVAWGITNGFSNAADLVRIRPNRRGVFKIKGKTLQIKKFRPVVWVKRGPIHFPVFWKSFNRTSIGPILPLGSKPGEMILLRWTGYHIERPPLDVPLAMMKAQSVEEMDKVFQRFTMPCWNFVFADTKGAIGYRQVGLVAKRAKGHRGLLDSADPKQAWGGFLTPREMPHLLNPGRGFIATANNHAFPKGYPHYLGQGYIIGHRAKRIETLLKATPKHTLQSMQKIQLDIVVPLARLLLPTMLDKIDSKGLPKDEAAALLLLKSWDLRADRNAVAPTLFRVWVRRLERTMFAHDIVRPNTPRRRTDKTKVKVLKPFRPGDPSVIAAVQGKLELSLRKPIATLLREALRKTCAQLKEHLGPDMKKWQWGRYHKNAFFHMLDRRIPFHPPAQPMHGGVETVSPALLRGDGPFTVRNAASYRLVVELVPGRIRSWGVLAGKNIDDKPRKLGKQQRLWLDHKYRPRPYYPDEIKKHKKSSRVITF